MDEIYRTWLDRKGSASLVENILWTAFPAADHWMNLTKYKQGATEPDNKVMKLVHFQAGWAPVDLLMVEVKRESEGKSGKAFNRIAKDLLDDFMTESSNPDGTTLFGAVGIEAFVKFYKKVLPNGALESFHSDPLHLETDAKTVQEYFDFFKLNVPGAAAGGTGTTVSTSGYRATYTTPGSTTASTSSYQTTYTTPGSTTASISGYQATYTTPGSTTTPSYQDTSQTTSSSYQEPTASYQTTTTTSDYIG